MTKTKYAFLTASILLSLCACSMAPPLPAPEKPSFSAFKEKGLMLDAADQKSAWKLAEPAEGADRGAWWTVFKDSTLNKLEEKAASNNQSLKAAAARVQQARALAGMDRANLFPQLGVGANVSRSAASGASLGLPAGSGPGSPTNLYRANATLSYEADLFGRLGDGAKASRATADAAEDTFKSVLLALQADVATHYFTLRQLKTDHALLTKTLAMRQENKRILQKRFDLGDATSADLARAETDVALVNGDMLETERRLLTTEHALAVLLGQAPGEASFTDVAELSGMPPVIPASVPSSVLERRPDIAAAQKTLAAANAKIGVAKAAFFPKITLTASDGYESHQLEDLFKWSSRTWVLGPLFGTAITLPVFDGGRNKANLALANAQYEEAVALYRQNILTAFRDVEDGLAATRLYAAHAASQKKAVESARRAAHVASLQYTEGYAPYQDVIETGRVQLGAERGDAQIKLAQYTSTINLIRALGGGW